MIAHLPELVYLDFRLIDESAREAATEKYKYSIEELVHDETIAKRKQEELEEKLQERQLHKVCVCVAFSDIMCTIISSPHAVLLLI